MSATINQKYYCEVTQLSDNTWSAVSALNSVGKMSANGTVHYYCSGAIIEASSDNRLTVKCILQGINATSFPNDGILYWKIFKLNSGVSSPNTIVAPQDLTKNVIANFGTSIDSGTITVNGATTETTNIRTSCILETGKKYFFVLYGNWDNNNFGKTFAGNSSGLTITSNDIKCYIYNGSAWVPAYPTVYTSSGWQEADSQVYNSGWK